jgi:thiamine-phosphate pyrophosphorylase
MPPLERLVDACRNRTLEGLRTLEDLARFTRDDQSMAAVLKQLRHDVAAAVADGWNEVRLLAARDTAGDVGTTLETDSETSRASVADIAHAAAGRVAEGLRSLEEASKVNDMTTARRLEQVRYTAYDISATLIGHLRTGGPRQWRLCLLLDRDACVLPWREVLDAALNNGVDCVQVREKHTPDDDLLAHCLSVVECCHAHGASVIVNDRADLAVASSADGVHLGRHDLSVAAARTVVGSGMVIGVSTHGVADAEAALEAGADYVGIGPIFDSGTKPGLQSAGPQRVVDTLAAIGDVPHLAIGGIDASNIGQIAVTGARGVAVGGAVCGAAEPGCVCAALVAALEPAATL